MSSTQQGFTLVELMVTVAIIGLLSAVAIPNFKSYQARSKTVEAKLQLSAAYTSMYAFYADNDAFHGCLKYMGFDPSASISSRYYAVGMAKDASCVACGTAVQRRGVSLDPGLCYVDHTPSENGSSFFPAGKSMGATTPIDNFDQSDIGGGVALALRSFILGAAGIIDYNYATLPTASVFTINEQKIIKQVRNGH